MAIDSKILNASSAFAGFANLPSVTGSVTVPAGQAVGAGSSVYFTFTIARADTQSMSDTLASLSGPTSSDGTTHSPTMWKKGGGGSCVWVNIDGVADLLMRVYVSQNSVSLSTYTLEYTNNSAGLITYNVAVTATVKAYFYKFPWS